MQAEPVGLQMIYLIFNETQNGKRYLQNPFITQTCGTEVQPKIPLFEMMQLTSYLSYVHTHEQNNSR